MESLGLYIHIPYCRTRCPYCDFVSCPIDGDVPQTFVDVLCREISGCEGPGAAQTIFFGGGTPSLLRPSALEQILAALHRRFRFATAHPETTLEANPDDVTPALADAWRALGINRVSLGVQSFDDGVLRYLGRRHDADGARRACDIIASRFDNWSMDMIYGAPPIEAWEHTLAEAAARAPRHVSAYSLTYEEGTRFAMRKHEAADDDVSLDMYRLADALLDGYAHYEISNFTQPGYACAHNLIYWHNGEYAGFGPGAYAFIGGARMRNAPDIEAYLAQPGAKAESLALTPKEIQVETLIQHFRLAAGISKADFSKRFGALPEQEFGAKLDVLCQRGLLIEDGDYMKPTRKGFELNNEIGLALVD